MPYDPSGSKMDRQTELNIYNKVKLSPYRPWRPLGLREVEAQKYKHFV
jgi:hypothetical protein